MADAVLSAVLPLIIEKLVSETSKNVAIYKGIDAEIKKWHKWLTRIQDVLADAAQKEITSQSVKRWLNDLQDLVYDIDDVLDGWAIDAMHREITHDSESGPVASTSMVRKLIPSCCTNFSPRIKMHENLAIIDARLEFLFKQKDNLGLIVKEETRPNNNNNNNNRRFQSSVVDPSKIVGRQDEEQALVHQLLGDDEPCDDNNFSIVPIYGMGGVGKTTLARLLYNKKEVKDHFELMGWVCISDDPFDVFGRTKEIFSSMGGEVNKQFENFNKLHEAVRDHVKGKRFLLVLDDIWSVSYEDWKTLVEPFCTCAPGSKIIITTRKHQLLKRLVYNPLNNPLQGLSDDDALSLLARHALGEKNFDSHLSLKSHAKDIVKKCGGLPLALIALGGLLGTKRYEAEHWKEVSNSEIWELKDEDEVLPALRLSYQDLSAPLKQLFAYCSLFPKDFLFDKEELVKLWMAEGFLHPSTSRDSTEECLGRDYFDELLSRSFFQLAPYNKSRFVMHDLMNDLAMYVAREFFVRLDVEEKKHIQEGMLEKYRHVSFVRETFEADKKFEAFRRAKKLRTLLATGDRWNRRRLSNNYNILFDLLGGLKLLRVLSLADFEISEVPESLIDTLKHLRYLNLSQTGIKCLPENVCNLYHLQALILFRCYGLAKLPNSFSKLKNLQHFDVRDTPRLEKMPSGIDELKRLQTLSKIIIGGENGFEINKLKEFKNLCGDVSIMGLDKVQNATYAREANLSQKRISELKLVWSDVFDGSRNEVLEEDVLNELRPHNDCLEQLEIVSYGGLEFPTWVGGPSFLQLKSVSIRGCTRCTSLPPLGQLPALTQLFIEGLVTVEVVDIELLGTSIEFHSLEILSFKSMAGWKTWSTDNGDVFPCLQELYIENCPNLVEVSVKKLRKLDVLEIEGCDSGVLKSLVQVASNVTKLTIKHISGLNDMVWKEVTECLGAVEHLNIISCKEIRYLWESEVVASKVLVNLKELTVRNCDDLVSLGEKEDNSRSTTSLTKLEVIDNRNMERCSCPDNIERLILFSNSSITSLSLPSGQKLKTLGIFHCPRILEREWGGQKMPKLEGVLISEWHNLKSITELKYLVHLTRLGIEDCKSLESFPDNELPYLTTLKELYISHCPSMKASFGMWPPKLQDLKIGGLKKPISEWGPQKFPTSLVNLYLFGGGDGVSDCCQISHLLPSSLTTLRIREFEKLETVSMGLQHLTSLQHLLCNNCPNMMDLPEKLVPSLLRLEIFGCLKLTEKCSEGGSYAPLISHIPTVNI